jgi:hypothetical protein
MTIATFPRAFPLADGAKLFIEADLQPFRRQALGLAGAGRDFVIDRGLPQWRGTWKTNRLSAADHGKWRGWRDSLRGASRYFLGWDPLREYPLAYMPAGFGALAKWDTSAWAGEGYLAGVGTAYEGRDQAQLADLPSGLVLQAGDYVAIQWADSPAFDSDLTAGADSWTATNATWALSGGGYLLTPSGADPHIDRTFTTVSGATYGRLVLDVERVTTGGTVELGISFTQTDNTVRTIASAFRLSASAGVRTRQTIDLSALSAFWAASGVKALRIDPVSTAAGSFRFRRIRLAKNASESQRYSLHRVIDTDQITADASGLANVWVEPEIPVAVPAGAIIRVKRAAGKFRKVSENGLAAQADYGSRPGDFSFTGVSTLL